MTYGTKEDTMHTSFCIDRKLDVKLQCLMEHFSIATKSEVLLRAIALLDIAARYENDDGILTILHSDKTETKVILRGADAATDSHSR